MQLLIFAYSLPHLLPDPSSHTETNSTKLARQRQHPQQSGCGRVREGAQPTAVALTRSRAASLPDTSSRGLSRGIPSVHAGFQDKKQKCLTESYNSELQHPLCTLPTQLHVGSATVDKASNVFCLPARPSCGQQELSSQEKRVCSSAPRSNTTHNSEEDA